MSIFEETPSSTWFGPVVLIYILLVLLSMFSCGEMGKVSNQSFHCMTEGGDDYCKPQPTPIPGRDGSPGTPGATGPEGTRGPTGPVGSPGETGQSGSDGYSIVSSTTVLATGDALCSTGGTLIRIARDLNRDGLLDSQDDRQQISTICNGSDGTAGEDGEDGADAPPTAFTPVSIVDPCGDAPGIYDEIFLRLQNGTLLWSLSDNSNGLNTRFSVAVQGSWVTTDGSGCYFSVDSAGAIYNEHH